MALGEDIHHNRSGFTLIEMAIVLVVIGLVVGGVLVGQDLIRAAYVRAQISQIEKFNTAVNTFYGKYQALPGDMNNSVAQANGFAARGTCPGQGDGNGVLEGLEALSSCTTNGGFVQGTGETLTFWIDLTTANGLNLNLIEGSFNGCGGLAGPTSYIPNYAQTLTSTPCNLGSEIPQAKIGNGNYIYVFSGGNFDSGPWSSNGTNYYGISAVYNIGPWDLHSTPAISVRQTYNIDKKIDDGFPQSGRVIAQYINRDLYPGVLWVAGDQGPTDTTTATPPSATSCYDDGGVTGATRVYSLSQNYGNSGQCALSFQFQGGD